MPPLPSTLDEETQNLIESIRRRQKDLSEFQIPRLRDCRGPLTVQQTILADVREDMETFARQVEVSYTQSSFSLLVLIKQGSHWTCSWETRRESGIVVNFDK